MGLLDTATQPNGVVFYKVLTTYRSKYHRSIPHHKRLGMATARSLFLDLRWFKQQIHHKELGMARARSLFMGLRCFKQQIHHKEVGMTKGQKFVLGSPVIQAAKDPPQGSPSLESLIYSSFFGVWRPCPLSPRKNHQGDGYITVRCPAIDNVRAVSCATRKFTFNLGKYL